MLTKTIRAHARTRTQTNLESKGHARISPKGFYIFPMHKFRLAASGSKGTFRDNTDSPGEFLLLSCATRATRTKNKEDLSYYADHKRPLCFCRCCLVGLVTRCRSSRDSRPREATWTILCRTTPFGSLKLMVQTLYP